MKSNIKKLKNCKRIVEIKLPADRVKDEFNKVYEGIQKLASVPGYRVGKVPKDLLELHYGKTAKEEVIKSLVPETYRKILEEYKLDPIGYPDISEIKLDLNEGFSYKAGIETRPEFSLKNYKALRLKKKPSEVKDEDIQRNLESLREAGAQNIPKNESGEKEKVLPKLDDDFAKDLGLESLVKLKDAVRENLKNKLEREAQMDLETQVINQLLGGLNFEIPETLVTSEKERLLKDAKSRIAYIEAIQKEQGKPDDKKFNLTDKDRKELEENAQKQAVRQVKVFFILDKIALSEKIHITHEELDERMKVLADQHKKTKEEIKKQLEKNHMLDELAVNMRNVKVMQFLLKESKVS